MVAALQTNTTIAQQYSTANGWDASVDQTTITRYDMAQILANVATAQSWEAPDSLTLMYARLLIKDWDSIPTQYRNAVASSYARGFLSGDDQGNFNGEASTKRAEAAVVLCALDESRTTITAPTYTNTNRLTNGLAATEANVSDLLSGLRNTYPNYGSWNMDRSYTSRVLGTGTGSRAFTYMLSDQVFGAMRSTRLSDPKDLRVGDVVTLSGGQYGLVASVSDTSFTYVTCNSSGVITWGNTMNLRSLSSSNTVYTRYGSLPAGDNTLTDGSRATESNVSSLLRDLKKDYKQGEGWDDDYDSDELGNGDRHSKGFAYFLSDEVFGDLDSYGLKDWDLSDEVFGDLDSYGLKDWDELRIGDLVYVEYDNEDGDTDYRWGLVYDYDEDKMSKNDEFTYVTLDENDDIDWGCEARFKEIEDMISRYPDEDKDQADDELTNGKSVKESNVDSLLGEVLEDFEKDFNKGKWDLNDEYNSNVFPDADGSEGFAYYISDEIFGDLDYEVIKNPEADELRIGDVIRIDGSQYAIVSDYVDRDDTYCEYVTIDEDGLDEGRSCRISKIDRAYTRYLTSSSSSSFDEDEVSADLEDVLDNIDYDYDHWNMDREYDFDSFGDGVTGSEAFAYYVSDEVFGENRSVDDVDSKYDLRVGDVIYDTSKSRYGIVLTVDEDEEECKYVSVDEDGDFDWSDRCDFDDISSSRMYTRY